MDREPASKSDIKKVAEKHLVAIAVGVTTAVVAGVILAFLTGLIGTDSASQSIVLTDSSSSPAEPRNFGEAVSRRSFWTSTPFFPKHLEPAEEPVAPVNVPSLDLKITSARELVESPERFKRTPVIFMGLITEQQDVPGDYIGHEYRLVGPESNYDVYVVGSRYSYARTGKPAWVLGNLAAVGESRDFRGKLHKSAYIDARSLESVVENINRAIPVGSRAAANALAELQKLR